MTKRDLFKVAIRLFALLSLVTTLFQTIPTLLGYNISFSDIDFAGLMIVLIIAALIFMLFRFLFIRTDKIIDWLRLDKGFDDDRIVFGESSLSTLVKLTLILFGVYILVINVPTLLADIYYWFSSKVNFSTNKIGQYEFKAIDWYYYISNLIIAFLFLFNHEYLAGKIIGFKRKEKD